MFLYVVDFSDWKFMSNSVVNVFSKHVRFQDLGLIPWNEGNMWGWSVIQGFISLVNFHAGNLCPILWSTFFSKHARFHHLGPILSNGGDLQGWPITWDFLSIGNFHAGNLCAILWSTFSQNRRPGTNSIKSSEPVRVANHMGFYFYH